MAMITIGVVQYPSDQPIARAPSTDIPAATALRVNAGCGEYVGLPHHSGSVE